MPNSPAVRGVVNVRPSERHAHERVIAFRRRRHEGDRPGPLEPERLPLVLGLIGFARERGAEGIGCIGERSQSERPHGAPFVGARESDVQGIPSGCGAEGGIRTHKRLPSAVFETAAYAIPPLRPGAAPIVPRAGAASRPEPRDPPVRRVCRATMLDSPRLIRQHRRPEGPPTVEDLRSTTVTDDPVQRRDLILIERARDGRPRCLQRPRRALPGPAVRARRADGPRPRPGVGRGPGGVLLGLPQPHVVPWRERQVLAQPDLRQRGDGHAAGAQAATGPAVPGARGRELAAAGRRRRPTPSGPRSTPSGAAPSRRRWPTSPTTSARRSSCTTSRATTTARSPT